MGLEEWEIEEGSRYNPANVVHLRFSVHKYSDIQSKTREYTRADPWMYSTANSSFRDSGKVRSHMASQCLYESLAVHLREATRLPRCHYLLPTRSFDRSAFLPLTRTFQIALWVLEGSRVIRHSASENGQPFLRVGYCLSNVTYGLIHVPWYLRKNKVAGHMRATNRVGVLLLKYDT